MAETDETQETTGQSGKGRAALYSVFTGTLRDTVSEAFEWIPIELPRTRHVARAIRAIYDVEYGPAVEHPLALDPESNEESRSEAATGPAEGGTPASESEGGEAGDVTLGDASGGSDVEGGPAQAREATATYVDTGLPVENEDAGPHAAPSPPPEVSGAEEDDLTSTAAIKQIEGLVETAWNAYASFLRAEGPDAMRAVERTLQRYVGRLAKQSAVDPDANPVPMDPVKAEVTRSLIAFRLSICQNVLLRALGFGDLQNWMEYPKLEREALIGQAMERERSGAVFAYICAWGDVKDDRFSKTKDVLTKLGRRARERYGLTGRKDSPTADDLAAAAYNALGPRGRGILRGGMTLDEYRQKLDEELAALPPGTCEGIAAAAARRTRWE